MTNRNSIGIVLINYFNDAEVIAFIRNYLSGDTRGKLQIYVLDNGTKDESLKSFCGSQDNLKYLNPGKNLGYIGGFLHVIKSMSQKPALMILSNTDIEFDSSVLDGLGNFEMKEDEVMISPSVVSSRTDKKQNPFYEQRISTSKLKMLEVVFSNYLTYSAYQILGILKAAGKGQAGKNILENTRHVYAIHGSFMVFKTSFLEKYFYELQDAPFLFGEEIQFAEVALKHRLKTLYCPQFKVKHHEHATTKLFKSGKMLSMLKDSIAFRLKKRREEES